MDKRYQLDVWKRLFSEWSEKEEEIGRVLTGERAYIFDVLDYVWDAVVDLYYLDHGEWNEDVIFHYVNGDIDYDTFLNYTVEEGGSYEGLRSAGASYWKEPFLVIDNSITEVMSNEE